MLIVKHVAHLREWVKATRSKGESIGFVPTMGALHRGHLSLIEKSKQDGQHTVVSIFVNPTQFNDPEDLKKYPRPLESDIRMLYEIGTEVLFLPDVEDIYPPGESHEIDFDPGPAAEVMEGRFRPGHFKGMAQVVYRLLEIVSPDKLYMGQKDFQQFAIIRKMISDFQMPIDLVMCPTIREDNGLAMSSRNMRLSQEGRERAAGIYRLLQASKAAFASGIPIEEIEQLSMQTFQEMGFQPEYFEIVDGYTLQRPDDQTENLVALCAVWLEGVRLIDNLAL